MTHSEGKNSITSQMSRLMHYQLTRKALAAAVSCHGVHHLKGAIAFLISSTPQKVHAAASHSNFDHHGTDTQKIIAKTAAII